MPNYCSSTLRFVLPHNEDVLDSFLNAIKGPQDWFFPIGAIDPTAEHSAHELLAREAAVHAVTPAWVRDQISDRLEAIGGHRLPDWMPICHATAEAVVRDPDWLHTTSEAISFPRLMGNFDEETYLRALQPRSSMGAFLALGIPALPALPAGPAAPSPTTLPTERFVSHAAFQQADLDVIGMIRSKIGTKWAPFDIHFDAEEDVYRTSKGTIVLDIRYTTAWTPVSCLREALWDVLAAHQAKLLCWWDDGGGGYGSELLDPSQDKHESWTIEITPPDADEDGTDAPSEDDPLDADGAPASDDEDTEDGGWDNGDSSFYENLHVHLEHKAVDTAEDEAFRL